MTYYNSKFKKVKDIKDAMYNVNNGEIEILYQLEGAYMTMTFEEILSLAEIAKYHIQFKE